MVDERPGGDGFVLAGDSRGSIGCTPLTGEFEKVFAIGKRSGIVVAGLIGSSDAGNQLRESVAKQLHLADEGARTSTGLQPQATSTIWSFVEGVRSELSLLDTSIQLNSPIAAASAISVSDKGVPEWITVFLTPVHQSYRPGEEHWALRVDHFVEPPEDKVISLGAGDGIVQQLVSRDGPDPNDPASQEGIMRRYYLLKREHRLSELSVDEGKALAQLLVKSAIAFADANPAQCLGIGGDIAVLAVTRQGPDWVLPLDKARLAPASPSFAVRAIDGDMFGRLDGVQWLRGTVPANAILTFQGQGDVLMIQPKFRGKCTFVLSEEAEQKMPDTVTRLRSALGEKCDVYRQTRNGRVRLSTATGTIVPSVHHDFNQYASLCNRDLRTKAREVAAQLRAFLNAYLAADRRMSEEEWLAKRRLNDEDSNVFATERSLLRVDRSSQFRSDYETQFVPTAISVRREMIKRVPLPARVGSDAGQKGATTMEMYEVADDLDAVASKLPDAQCPKSIGDRDTPPTLWRGDRL